MVTHSGDGSSIKRDASQETAGANSRKAVVWIVVAFGCLVVDLVGGTILFAWKNDWAWVFPLASFVAYILAFRRGMLLLNPNIDRTWRRYFWLERETTRDREETSSAPTDQAHKPLTIVRPETLRPPRQEMRLIR